MNAVMQKLKSCVEKSPFSQKPNYELNITFKSLFLVDGAMTAYNDAISLAMEERHLNPSEIVERLTPDFQRSNTCWSREMQISFIENLVSGCASKVLFYYVGEPRDYMSDCKLLDGLQRSGSIASFQQDEFPIFDDIYWSDLSKGGILPIMYLTLEVYRFDTELQAVEFYISMNKNITHSEDDLLPAYNLIKELKEAA